MHSPFFFLHIPRTAGTTLNSVLENNFSPEETIRIYDREEYEKYKYVEEERLDKVKLITGHLLLEKTNPPTFYGRPVRAFTFLREPLARLASEYDFLRTWKANHLYSLLNDNRISFAGYLASEDRMLIYRGKNFMTRCISGMSFHEAYPEKALARAKENLKDQFVFLGIQERFFESLVMLGDVLGMGANILHDKRNALKKEVKTPLSKNGLELARELNQADIELYEYACQLFDERVTALGQEFQARLKHMAFLNAKYQKISQLIMEREDGGSNTAIDLPKDGLW